jgi:hypothetical protein
MNRAIHVFLIGSAALLMFTMAQPAQAQTVNPSTIQTSLQYNLGLMSLMPQPTTTDPPGNFHHVQPADFDPGKTYLVQSTWLSGIGCPTNATIALPNATFTGVGGFSSFTDTACPNMPGAFDAGDHHNEGLLLVKTGPTITNFAAATAELINVKGTTLTELGYDIRKPGSDTYLGVRGSHCGAGAPRFNVTTTDGFFFVGCSSPPRDTEIDGQGWIRLRWGVMSTVMGFNPAHGFALEPITGTVQRIMIVFDEAQDAFGGPDEFGAAILDNIDFNGTLVGQGSVTAN